MTARPEHLGIVYDMPLADYLAVDALSATGLKRLRESPLHFYAKQLDPDAGHGEPTPAMVAGTLAHTALLEPQTLDQRYAVKPPGHDGRTKEGKAWNAEHAGRILVTAEQMQAAKRQAAAVRALPEIAQLMSRGRAEVSAFWIDNETGEHCKCRPDFVAEVDAGVVLIDLKTCPDASPRGFPRVVANMDYHLQHAWYVDGYERASGRMVLGFIFAAVEHEYPHAAGAYMLDEQAIAAAREENRRLTRLYASCRASNLWPGYPDAIQPITLPAWAI